MRQGDGQFQILVQRNAIGDRVFGINGDGQINFGSHIGGDGPLIFDFQFQDGFFAQNRKGGRVGDDQTAIPIGGATCQKNVQRGGQGRREAQIMHLAVGHQDRCCNAGAGFFGHRLGQRRHGQ